MFIMIFVFMGIMLVADMICAVEVKQLEIGAKGTIPCGHLEYDTEIRTVQWYKSRRIDMFINGDDSLAWKTETETGSLLNFHLENTTFSLVIYKTMLEDEGLYLCSVLRGDLLVESKYFTRTVTYALPRMGPKVTLDTDLNHVRCTVEHVKPVIYPVFNFHWSPESTETYAVLNEDGTFTTSICCPMPQTKISLRVNCSFSYLSYQGVGSLDLPDVTTDSLIEDKTPTVSHIGPSVTFAGDRCTTIIDRTATIVLGIIIALLMVIIIIFFNASRKLRRKYLYPQNWNRAKESEEIFRPCFHEVTVVNLNRIQFAYRFSSLPSLRENRN